MSIIKRDESMDILKGIAILLVLLGHTISTSTLGFENSIIYNVIWSIQMPLFMFVSGYLFRFIKDNNSDIQPKSFILRKSISYLLPFFMWAIVIRGLIVNQISIDSLFDYLIYLAWNLDNSYWFLISIFMINVLFYYSNFLLYKYNVDVINSPIKVSLGVIVLCSIYFVIGYIISFEFLSLKLTIYYVPFFILGYLTKSYINKIEEHFLLKNNIEYIYVLIVFIYFGIIYNHNLFTSEDTIVNILIRVITSCAGIFIVFYYTYLTKHLNNFFKRIISWLGKNSLEFYMTHYLFLSVLKPVILPNFMTIDGLLYVVINFSIMFVFTFLGFKLLSSNKLVKYIFYGKSPQNRITN